MRATTRELQDKKINCECDKVQNARTQLRTEGGSELFNDFLSTDM